MGAGWIRGLGDVAELSMVVTRNGAGGKGMKNELFVYLVRSQKWAW